MADPTSIPKWLKTQVAARVEIEDERSRKSNPILAFFPEEDQEADTIEIRTETLTRPESLFTTIDGKGHEVDGGTYASRYYSPAWTKPSSSFGPRDFTLFDRFIESGAGESSAMAKADRLTAGLTKTWTTWRKQLVFGALQGTLTGTLIGGNAITVSYGLTALANVGTVWSNIASTILADLRTMALAYRAATGERFNAIAYRAATLGPYLATNTDILTRFGSVEAFMATFAQIQANPIVGNAFGEMLGIGADVTWFPVDDIYENRAGTSTNHWDGDYLTLFNTDLMGGAVTRTAIPGMVDGPGLNVQIKEPLTGDAVQKWTVQGFDNGLATFTRPDVVIRQRIAGF
jgi:hypothetical protein